MATMILDRELEAQLIAERKACGGDHHDEVWEGVYVMAPLPNIEHQKLIGDWTVVLYEIVTSGQLGTVLPGVNVSDRVQGWQYNYRVPDVAVFLKTTKAIKHEAFSFGGPDFAIEIVSPDDRSREKLEFYGRIGCGELLIIDRYPWQMELYRNSGGKLELITSMHPGDDGCITSRVLPLQIKWQMDEQRPRMLVEHLQTKKAWVI